MDDCHHFQSINLPDSAEADPLEDPQKQWHLNNSCDDSSFPDWRPSRAAILATMDSSIQPDTHDDDSYSNETRRSKGKRKDDAWLFL